MNQVRQRVLSLIKKGAFTAAVTAAADFARRNPRSADSYALLSLAEEVAGYTKAAIKTISQAIALAPHEPAYWLQRGRLHLAIQAAAQALGDLTRVIEMERDCGIARHSDTASAYRDEALRQFKRTAGTPDARLTGGSRGIATSPNAAPQLRG